MKYVVKNGRLRLLWLVLTFLLLLSGCSPEAATWLSVQDQQPDTVRVVVPGLGPDIPLFSSSATEVIQCEPAAAQTDSARMERVVRQMADRVGLAENPKGSNRSDSLDAWAAAFGFKYKSGKAPGVMWCAIFVSTMCRYEGLPFWTTMAYGFVQQGRVFGYRVISADLVLRGLEVPARGWIAVRRSATGDHVDVVLHDWVGRSGWVIGGNVDDAVTKRYRTLTADRHSYSYFIEVL